MISKLRLVLLLTICVTFAAAIGEESTPEGCLEHTTNTTDSSCWIYLPSIQQGTETLGCCTCAEGIGAQMCNWWNGLCLSHVRTEYINQYWHDHPCP